MAASRTEPMSGGLGTRHSIGFGDNRGLTATTPGCHTCLMTRVDDANGHAETFRHLNEVREEALKHARRAQQLAGERRDIIRSLIKVGFSQAEIAREMGVTRQAVQKMLTL